MSSGMAGRSDCTLGPSPVSGSCPLTHGTENVMNPEIKRGREFSTGPPGGILFPKFFPVIDLKIYVCDAQDPENHRVKF